MGKRFRSLFGGLLASLTMIYIWLRNGCKRTLRDDELSGDSRTLRTIQAGSQFVKDAKTAEWRVSSGAFSPPKDGCISVDLEQLLHADNKASDALFPGLPRALGLIAHKIEGLRGEGLTVHHEQVAGNFYHGCIRGKPNDKLRRRLSRNYEIVVPFNIELAEYLAAELIT